MDNQKSALISIIGPPNAGKSTLLNNILGEKVSIVSHKVQTTRTRIRGILTEGDTQIVFTDTPGLFKPKKKLEKAIVQAAVDGMGDADAFCIILDCSYRTLSDWENVKDFLPEELSHPVYLVLNKIDKIDTKELLALSQKLNDDFNFTGTYMISATKGNGVDDLVKELLGIAKAGPWFYPEDQLTDLPNRLMAAEITREHLFHNLHQELPYNLTVETEDWENFNNGDVKLSQIIYVTRSGHKGIILGKQGETLKRISIASRKELEQLLERRVHLKIFIKVKENWMDDPERYTLWGLGTE